MSLAEDPQLKQPTKIEEVTPEIPNRKYEEL
jgi:hypothetical protein